MHHWDRFDKILLIASSSGNWNNFLPRTRIMSSIAMKTWFPMLGAIYGYVPAWTFLGQDWPLGILKQLSECSRQNILMADY